MNGSFTLNAANSIATVAGNAGSISFTDSSALSVGTVNTAGLTSTGAVLLTSGGDISQTASISTTATGNAIVLDAAGNFINKAGAAALSAPNGRWLVYSTDPALDTFGGLMSGNLALWGKTSINYAPGSVVEAGNRYLFSLVPALSVSADLVKIYGTDLTLAPPPATINGLIDAAAYGNVFTQDAVTGTASLTSTGFAATAAISVNPYPVIVAAGTLLAPAGYGVTTYITGSVYVLAPAVVDEIVEISNQRPRKTADALALETPPADGGNTQPIPMCN